MTVTLVLAPRDGAGLIGKAEGTIGHRPQDVDDIHRPGPASMRRVVAWCEAQGLNAQAAGGGYLVEASGRVADVEAAFCARLDTWMVGGVRGRAVRGEPTLGLAVRADVAAILGLNDLARPRPGRLRRPGGASGASGPASGGGYMPNDLRHAYGLPQAATGVDGRGELVVAVALDRAASDADLALFWQQAGVPTRVVRRHWALGPGEAEPAQDGEGGIEATSDVEWLGALAPGAALATVIARSEGSGATFAQALARALALAATLQPTPAVISIGHGAAEALFASAELWALDLLCARAAALGITVVAASGDCGAYGAAVPVGPLESVEAPACLPHVLAVGGTRLELAGQAVAREVGWSERGGGASGGGVSEVFAVPAWQDAEAVAAATGRGPGRGVPDVSAVADPLTGDRVVLASRLDVVGGTSLAAPVWAAAVALVDQVRRGAGHPPLGLAAPSLYPLASRPTAVRDILVGDNAYLSARGYGCRTGWDAVTGIGAPAGPALWRALAGDGWPASDSADAVVGGRDRLERATGREVATVAQGTGADASEATADAGNPRAPGHDTNGAGTSLPLREATGDDAPPVDAIAAAAGQAATDGNARSESGPAPGPAAAPSAPSAAAVDAAEPPDPGAAAAASGGARRRRRSAVAAAATQRRARPSTPRPRRDQEP